MTLSAADCGVLGWYHVVRVIKLVWTSWVVSYCQGIMLGGMMEITHGA
jgi:hypothetical protein